jgi:hypothetical protein
MWFYYFGESKSHRFDRLFYMNMILNDEVEILEEEKKITPTDFENLGYALGSIQKYINKGYDKAIEEKKIPEKLYLSDYEDTTGKFDYDVLLTINEIIDYLDYLKSKGE